MNKVRIGIVGMGRMGITHFSIINTHPKVELVSVSDTSKITLEILAKNVPGLKTYTDFNDQLNADDLDGIIVCTPPNLHHRVCKLACEKGISVFCEKPFTTDTNEAKDLAEMFAKAGLVNQVGYVNRFNDMFATARKYVKDGLIGDVIRFKSEMFSCTICKPETGDGWRSKRENGGGATYEMAAHALDLVNYIVGVPDKIVGSSLNQIYSKHVDDIVSSTLLYKNGCSGTLYVNWSDSSYRKPSNKLELFGSNGKLLADQHGMKIFLNETKEGYDYRKGWNTVYITDVFTPVPFYVRGNEFTRQLYHFADCILGEEKVNKCSFQAGYETQKIIHDIFDDFEKNGK